MKKSYPIPLPIIIFVAILLLGFTFYLLVNARNSKKADSTEIDQYASSLLSPTLNYIDEKDILVNFLDLKNTLTDITEEYPNAETSIYFEYLGTGANFSINGTYRHPPASLSKVPLAMIIYKKYENTELNLTDKVLIKPEHLDTNYGDLYKNNLKKEYTVEELLAAMIEDSDNTAKNALYEYIDETDLVEIISSIGIEELFDSNGATSVKEYSRLLRSLYTASYLNIENSEAMLEKMVNSSRIKYLPQSIPAETKVAHKFGVEKDLDTFNDAGIFYLENRPYILVVLSTGTNSNYNEATASEMMLRLSEASYDYVSGLGSAD